MTRRHQNGRRAVVPNTTQEADMSTTEVHNAVRDATVETVDMKLEV